MQALTYSIREEEYIYLSIIFFIIKLNIYIKLIYSRGKESNLLITQMRRDRKFVSTRVARKTDSRRQSKKKVEGKYVPTDSRSQKYRLASLGQENSRGGKRIRIDLRSQRNRLASPIQEERRKRKEYLFALTRVARKADSRRQIKKIKEEETKFVPTRVASKTDSRRQSKKKKN